MEVNNDEEIFMRDLLLRKYQIQLIKEAQEHSSIIFLPTGVGKTFIALCVLKSRLRYLKRTGENGGKLAVFLGTTRQLVRQLAAVIKENTTLKVGTFLGEMGIDFWSRREWEKNLEGLQVFCSTPNALLLAVQRKFVRISQITLLVFDECHHAVLNHPYNKVMKEFEGVSREQRPLILGLTATALNSNPQHDGMKEVEILKKNLHCEFARTSRLEEVMLYSTCPTEVFLEFSPIQADDGQRLILNVLRNCEKRMSSLKILGVREVAAKAIVPENDVLLHRRDGLMKDIRSVMRHLENILIELGLYATSLAALYYIIKMERLKYMSQNPATIAIIRYVVTVLNVVRRTIHKTVPSEFQSKDDLTRHSSSKVNSLIEFIEKVENPEKLRCLILVEERITAVIMATLFNCLSRLEKNNVFKADFITGGMFNVIFDQEESLEEQKLYRTTATSLAKLEYHCLFSTDVIEEGIDIPLCNLVIRFDEVNDYRKYIQSKGRARFKDSCYVLLCKEGSVQNTEMIIENFNRVQRNLLEALHSEEANGWDNGSDDTDDDEEYFFVQGRESAHITGTQAIGLIERYCRSLPQDFFSFLSPLCWYNIEDKTAYLKLPSVSPLREIIKGDPKKKRALSKKNVYLKAVKELHKLGEISDDFTFRKYTCIEENYKELFPNLKTSDEGFPTNGTSKRKRIYEINYAEKLSHCLPCPGSKSFLHVIKIKPECERPEDSRRGVFYDLLSDANSFALLSSKNLNKICDFPLFSSIGQFSCSLDVNASFVELNTLEIGKIRKFHFFLFHDLLGVVDRLQILDNRNEGHSFFIIPVKEHPKGKYHINWKAIDSVGFTEIPHLEKLVIENSAIEDYHLSVVYPKYRKAPGSNKYYIVTSLDHSQTPLSKFPSEDFDDYCTYFRNKYHVNISDKSQPLLEVKAIPVKINYLVPRKPSSLKKKRKYNDENENFQEHLVPELCCRLSVSASLWLKATILPSALHRITSICFIDDFRKMIAAETKLGIHNVDNFPWLPLQVEKDINEEQNTNPQFVRSYSSKNQRDISRIISEDSDSVLQPPIDLYRYLTECAPCDIKHYVSFFDRLGTKESSTLDFSDDNENVKLEAIHVPDLLIVSENKNEQGPQLRDFVKVFTCKSANDVIDLERLEFFGDSFLKFASALYLFKKYNDNEGVLTSMKNKIVSNNNLFHSGLAKGLQGALLVNEFEPRSDWNAPLFCLPQEITNLANGDTDSFEIDYSFEITVKEKLLGKLNPETIKAVQDFIGMKEKRSMYTPVEVLFSRKTVADKSIADCVEALIGIYVKECGLSGGFDILNWLKILPSEDGSYENLMKHFARPDLQSTDSAVLNEVLFEDVEQTIGYEFKDKFLLVEALTHPSYTGLAPSYQRLEFLGDSLLDFLITTYIFHNCSNKDPGKMTDIRVALVNNITLACLTVKYNLHKHILHHSPLLQNAIKNFWLFQKQRNYKIDVAVIVSKEECGGKVAGSIDVPKALGDLFESIAGAVFLDSGNSLDAVWRVFYRLMKETIDDFMQNPPMSPVRALYELCAIPPEFTHTELDTGYIKTICKVIRNDKQETFCGIGRNKALSKSSAAKVAVNFLQNDKNETT